MVCVQHSGGDSKRLSGNGSAKSETTPNRKRKKPSLPADVRLAARKAARKYCAQKPDGTYCKQSDDGFWKLGFERAVKQATKGLVAVDAAEVRLFIVQHMCNSRTDKVGAAEAAHRAGMAAEWAIKYQKYRDEGTCPDSWGQIYHEMLAAKAPKVAAPPSAVSNNGCR